MAAALESVDARVMAYLAALLSDTQLVTPPTDLNEPVLRFARVEQGHELVPFWQGPLSPAQQRCADLLLLSCLAGVSGPRLRARLIAAIETISLSADYA